MRAGSGFIIVVLGLILMYAVLSGKFACLETFINCLFDSGEPEPERVGTSTNKAVIDAAATARGIGDVINAARRTAEEARKLGTAQTVGGTP